MAICISKYRPKVHYTPAFGWQNDPNGLIYKDGIYHLYYQYYPNDTIWGPMHWGHAVSTDLYHWAHRPIALFPDDMGYMFSGSMVYDKNNTSGLGKRDIVSGEFHAPMIAAYTSHDHNTMIERQSIGVSLDNGRYITPYKNNPVIDYFEINGEIEHDFRDPKVFWNKYNACWTMVVAAHDRCHFYTSENLIDWTKTGEFAHPFKEITNCWACTDLIPIEVNGEVYWVLLASMEDRANDPEARTMYFVGKFDGSTYTVTEETEEPLWIDFGWDNYAGVSYNDTDEPIMLSWGLNPRYAAMVPSGEADGYRGLVTVPRKLELVPTEEGLRVAFVPYGLEAVMQEEAEVTSKKIEIPEAFLLKVHGEEGCVTIENKAGEQAVVSFTKDTVTIDRRQAGISYFHSDFRSKDYSVRTVKRQASGDINLSIIFDVSYVEAFADGGLEAGSMVVYPENPYTHVTLSEGLTATITELA